jgi:hypothetical protein
MQITKRVDAGRIKAHLNNAVVTDPTYNEWIKTRRTNEQKKGLLAYFLVYAGDALGRPPLTPTEYKDMRIAELNASRGKDSEVKKIIWLFVEHLRHVCWACGEWIDKDPFDRSHIPTMYHGDAGSPVCTFRTGKEKGTQGRTLAPNTRNNYFITSRGFLSNTISDPSASPFKKGENLDEFGWARQKKYSLEKDTWAAMIDHSSPPQALTLWVLRQTGMSGDASSLRITSNVEKQLGMRLTNDTTRDDGNNDLPDVVLFDWKRKKAMRGRADATIPRLAALYGEAIPALVKMIRKKKMVRGDPILMGQKGQPLTPGQMRTQVADVIQLAGIRTEGESLGPHVLRGEAYTDYVNVKSEMIAKVMTGKQVPIDQITYYNARPEEVKDIVRKCIPRTSVTGELKRENKSLKDTVSTMNSQLQEMAAGLRAMREDYATLVHANRTGVLDQALNGADDPRDMEIAELKEAVATLTTTVGTITKKEGG